MRRDFFSCRRFAASLALAASAIVDPCGPAQAQSVEDLTHLSIEELGKIEITSVSKQPQALKTAAASVYVISHDEIIRSGARTIPEILRLAPNLFVAQTAPDQYVITARGLSGNFSAQNFTNKLLVLIDGRSVYSPLFSGIYWDTVDVLPEDIERIEVISGPGATLWGANAVNGVINIITRHSAETQGGYLEVGIGNLLNLAALQYGGRLGEDATYRIYGRAFFSASLDAADGKSAQDGYYKPQVGFRVDWTPSGDDKLAAEGNFYYGAEEQLGSPDAPVEGRNLQLTWEHGLADGSSLQVLSYYDQSRRSVQGGGAGFSLTTYDLEAQHIFTAGAWNNIVWGAGERVSVYSIVDRLSDVNSLLFVPPERTLNLADVFVQDRITPADRIDVILGFKLEDDPWSGWSALPTARVDWKPDSDTLLWAAISRAIRSPTPFDTDVQEKVGDTVFLEGNPHFLPEQLTAYEIGYRGSILPDLSLSATAYFDRYDDLRTIELSPPGGLPLIWGNSMEGTVYGLEAWAAYQITDWWRLTAAANVQNEDLRFKPGASGLLGLPQAGDDPHHRASLRSSMNLTPNLTLDADLRYVGKLPNPAVPEYTELNARLGWRATERLELSLSGFNLLHSHHQEFTVPPSDLVRRNFLLEARWKF